MLIETPLPNDFQHPKNKKRINIAMQGGGAHGAFTWGALDKLLEDGRFEIEGVTGTSAGGMNAVATVQGLLDNGPEGARKTLKKYWELTSEKGKGSIFKPGLLDRMMDKYTMQNSPGFIGFDFMSKLLSPYQWNPFGIDPLKDVIKEMFNFEQIQNNKQHKVFLASTHVFTGKIRIFKTEEIRTETLLATACLPTIHQAVLVDNEYYWDGGFIANPAVYPLIYNCESPDILIIKLNPTHRNRLPITAAEISDRLNEITNNTSILREMRSINFISQLIDEGIADPKKIKRLHMHVIENDSTFQELGWSSKLNTEWDFLSHLFEEGRKTADVWIKKNYDSIGKRGTVDMKDLFV
ncbi:MAG: patatin-like phospholipase family protein [Holosporales bacterium]|jgi:NTE family protein|nr:patatin-like phospholipase family protein [Holosporales bacterium]